MKRAVRFSTTPKPLKSQISGDYSRPFLRILWAGDRPWASRHEFTYIRMNAALMKILLEGNSKNTKTIILYTGRPGTSEDARKHLYGYSLDENRDLHVSSCFLDPTSDNMLTENFDTFDSAIRAYLLGDHLDSPSNIVFAECFRTNQFSMEFRTDILRRFFG